MTEDQALLAQHMRSSFEASLSHRLERASRVNLQHFIPSHWFSAAASECASMYIAGFLYGTISVAQAYVEALTRCLAEHHHAKIPRDPQERCQYLYREGLISANFLAAALEILSDRNDFHHLNKEVEQDHQKLNSRAEHCINSLHAIESEIFAYTIGPEAGKLSLDKPEYWPSAGPGLTNGNLRQLW